LNARLPERSRVRGEYRKERKLGRVLLKKNSCLRKREGPQALRGENEKGSEGCKPYRERRQGGEMSRRLLYNGSKWKKRMLNAAGVGGAEVKRREVLP